MVISGVEITTDLKLRFAETFVQEIARAYTPEQYNDLTRGQAHTVREMAFDTTGHRYPVCWSAIEARVAQLRQFPFKNQIAETDMQKHGAHILSLCGSQLAAWKRKAPNYRQRNIKTSVAVYALDRTTKTATNEPLAIRKTIEKPSEVTQPKANAVWQTEFKNIKNIQNTAERFMALVELTAKRDWVFPADDLTQMLMGVDDTTVRNWREQLTARGYVWEKVTTVDGAWGWRVRVNPKLSEAIALKHEADKMRAALDEINQRLKELLAK